MRRRRDATPPARPSGQCGARLALLGRYRPVFAIALLLHAIAGAGADSGIVLQPETDHVDVSTTFAGTDIRILGTVDTTADLIIKVIGPAQDVTLSREVQRGPFWVGGGTATVSGAPNLVYLYATRPIASLLTPEERKKHGLDLQAVELHVAVRTAGIAEDRWRRAFFRLKEGKREYLEDDHAIRIARDHLVVTHVYLPPEVEFGIYRIEALLVRGGTVIGRDTASIDVRQVGIGRWLWQAGHQHAWLFGVASTVAAMVMGFVLIAATHRRR